MPVFMTFIFLVVVSGVSFALSAYTLSRLYELLCSVSTQAAEIEMIGWLDQASGWWISAGVIVSYFMIGKVCPTRPLRWWGWISGLWMGYISLLLFLAGPVHLVEWILFRLSVAQEYTSTLTALLTLGAVHLAMPLGVWGVVRTPRVCHLEVTSGRIGPSLNGFTILQLSDVHIGPTIGLGLIEDIHRRCLELKPDLIVMTGDLVDGEPRYLGEEVMRFLELKDMAPLGLYFITGNHEYISGASPWVQFIQDAGVTVLENQHVTLTREDEHLHLIGVEDWDAHRFDPRRAPHLAQALRGIEESQHFKLLLAHQPKAAPEASERGVDLQLSGHTHAGQIFPFNYLIYLDQPYNQGRYQVGDLTLYVNAGTGYWGPPLRLGTRAEMTLVTLRAAER